VFCPKCGAANEEDDPVCAQCGVLLMPPTAGIGTDARLSYAGFWKRFAAYIIDGIIVNIVMNVLGLIIVGSTVFSLRANAVDIAVARIAVYGIVSIVLVWLYSALMESSSSRATVGKMALGIVVTDLQGKRISFGRATGRFWGKYVSGAILAIGFIMAGFTERKQALHDMLAGTFVVNKWSV
jgi:uncharacterized RDD family membrane protein YckC